MWIQHRRWRPGSTPATKHTCRLQHLPLQHLLSVWECSLLPEPGFLSWVNGPFTSHIRGTVDRDHFPFCGHELKIQNLSQSVCLRLSMSSSKSPLDRNLREEAVSSAPRLWSHAGWGEEASRRQSLARKSLSHFSQGITFVPTRRKRQMPQTGDPRGLREPPSLPTVPSV